MGRTSATEARAAKRKDKKSAASLKREEERGWRRLTSVLSQRVTSEGGLRLNESSAAEINESSLGDDDESDLLEGGKSDRVARTEAREGGRKKRT